MLGTTAKVKKTRLVQSVDKKSRLVNRISLTAYRWVLGSRHYSGDIFLVPRRRTSSVPYSLPPALDFPQHAPKRELEPVLTRTQVDSPESHHGTFETSSLVTA